MYNLGPYNSFPFAGLLRLRRRSTIQPVDWLDALVTHISAEIETPLYPFSRPEGDDGPVIVYSPGVDNYSYTHDGLEPWVQTPLSIESNASSPDDAHTLDKLVKGVLEGFSGTLQGNKFDLVRSGLTSYRVGPDSRRKWRVAVVTEYTILRRLGEVLVA